MGPHPNVGVTDDHLYNLSLSMIGTSGYNTVYTSKVTISLFLGTCWLSWEEDQNWTHCTGQMDQNGALPWHVGTFDRKLLVVDSSLDCRVWLTIREAYIYIYIPVHDERQTPDLIIRTCNCDERKVIGCYCIVQLASFDSALRGEQFQAKVYLCYLGNSPSMV